MCEYIRFHWVILFIGSSPMKIFHTICILIHVCVRAGTYIVSCTRESRIFLFPTVQEKGKRTTSTKQN